jgi:hypothetical protein
MDREDFFNHLKLHDQYVIDQEIEPERLLENVPFVVDRDQVFTPDWNRPEIAFSLETFAVDAFD